MAAKLTDDELMAALRVVPQRIVGRMFGGRQTVHLQRMADQWGFPVDSKQVDLFAVLSRLWEFLKQHRPVLKVLMEDDGSDGDEGALGVQYLKAKIRKTKADADAAEIRNAAKEGQLCDRAQVHAAFGKIASAFQIAASTAQRKWGEAGFDFFAQLAENIASELQPLNEAATNADETEPQVDGAEPSDVTFLGRAESQADARASNLTQLVRSLIRLKWRLGVIGCPFAVACRDDSQSLPCGGGDPRQTLTTSDDQSA